MTTFARQSRHSQGLAESSCNVHGENVSQKLDQIVTFEICWKISVLLLTRVFTFSVHWGQFRIQKTPNDPRSVGSNGSKLQRSREHILPLVNTAQQHVFRVCIGPTNTIIGLNPLICLLSRSWQVIIPLVTNCVAPTNPTSEVATSTDTTETTRKSHQV